MVSLEHRDKVAYYYNLAKEEGATVEIGGGIPDMGDDVLNAGAWIEPTIWTGLSDDARVIKEEKTKKVIPEEQKLNKDASYRMRSLCFCGDSSARSRRIWT